MVTVCFPWPVTELVVFLPQTDKEHLILIPLVIGATVIRFPVIVTAELVMI